MKRRVFPPHADMRSTNWGRLTPLDWRHELWHLVKGVGFILALAVVSKIALAVL